MRCVGISGRNSFKGEECKIRVKNLNFLKNGKNNKIARMVKGSLENSLNLG